MKRRFRALMLLGMSGILAACTSPQSKPSHFEFGSGKEALQYDPFSRRAGPIDPSGSSFVVMKLTVASLFPKAPRTQMSDLSTAEQAETRDAAAKARSVKAEMSEKEVAGALVDSKIYGSILFSDFRQDLYFLTPNTYVLVTFVPKSKHSSEVALAIPSIQIKTRDGWRSVLLSQMVAASKQERR